MIFVILTIESRIELANETKQSLVDVGVNPEDIVFMFGYDKKDYPNMKKPYTLISRYFIDSILPAVEKVGEDMFYVEDGTLFSCNPLDYIVDRRKIVWMGYIFRHVNYICGSKCIYIPLDVVSKLIAKQIKRFSHIDRLIRNFGILNNNMLVLDQSIIYQAEYESSWGTTCQKDRKAMFKNKLLLKTL